MMQFGLIGIGAGAAGALLFASVTSGSWLSILLFYLAPLPIMIAGIGWSHWAALIGALSGALALGLVFGTVFFFAFLAGAGIPAWWLGYLTMLARPAGNGGAHRQNGGSHAAALEWYPPGRLIVWASLLAALVVLVAIPNFGTDEASFRAALHNALAHMLQVESGSSAGTPPAVPGVTNANRLIGFLVAAIPPAAAVLATITNIFNLWLAARIVKFSGLLKRPWPQLSAMTFPRLCAAALALTMALSFLDGMVGIVTGVLSASLLMAYGVLGLAVLHAITQGISSRVFLLGGVYVAVMVFGWPVLALCLLGLAETAIDVRGRVARKRGPPAPT